MIDRSQVSKLAQKCLFFFLLSSQTNFYFQQQREEKSLNRDLQQQRQMFTRRHKTAQHISSRVKRFLCNSSSEIGNDLSE